MTARTAITPVQLVPDGAISEGSGTSIAGLVAAGATIAAPPGPNKLVIIVNNSATASKNLTVRAGGNGVTASGGTNPGVPFEAATVGDLVVAVGASGTQVVTPTTSARYTQADGSLSLDFDSGMTGTIWVLQLPNSHIVEGF
jgi:hypothetical protein